MYEMRANRDRVESMGLKEYEGLLGAHTQEEAEGAWPNGTRIKKAVMGVGDSTPLGTGGRVLGSMPVAKEMADKIGMTDDFFYFVEWDSMKGYAVGVASHKLELAETTQ